MILCYHDGKIKISLVPLMIISQHYIWDDVYENMYSICSICSSTFTKTMKVDTIIML